MDGFAPEGQSNFPKRALLIGGSVVVVIGLVVAGVLVLRQRAGGLEEQPAPPATNQPGGVPLVNGPVAVEKVWPPLPPEAYQKPTPLGIPPGVDRPLTEEEKKKYGFVGYTDIWMFTTSPTDGSEPQASFYDKSAKPLTTEPDADHDGLSDRQEQTLGTDQNVLDSDGDGLFDYDEVNIYKTDPTKTDTDGDGRSDSQQQEDEHIDSSSPGKPSH